MKRSINKLVILLVLIFLFNLISCTSPKSYTNEVVTEYVNYEKNITIYDLEDALISGIEQCEDSVVGIEVSSRLSSGFGSGVIINSIKNGNSYTYYVLTNYHVVNHNDTFYSSIEIYLGKYDEEANATYKIGDKTKDIAIISFVSNRMLQVAKIGDSSNLKKGQFAVAIGNPYELKALYNSVTVGNISDPNRQYNDSNDTYRGNINYYIQHTAAINAGNSGGGLFDIYGNLIGINTWKIADVEIEGMGFAIPIHIIQSLFKDYF